MTTLSKMITVLRVQLLKSVSIKNYYMLYEIYIYIYKLYINILFLMNIMEWFQFEKVTVSKPLQFPYSVSLCLVKK